ncbi:hypothetical protein SAMN05216334_10973 [Nitrosomonas ureae]|uniref:Uncharacterized protein n=1 Tax=Nitrosomonas ureae TaxID=44577 RepID=A0A1H5UUG0_9PROT|nr:hypothetical protein SAMN05216334_10973 [Nitrosomonas ureae]
MTLSNKNHEESAVTFYFTEGYEAIRIDADCDESRTVAANGFSYGKTKVPLIYIIVLIRLGCSHVALVEVRILMSIQMHF